MKGAVSFGCALLLGLPISARSQTAAPGLDPQKPITQYVHDVWQIDQGLPQNSVMAMAQTRDGYLWVATEAGAARFDGVAFTAYNSTNASGLSDDFVNSLLADGNNLWAGTWVGGITRFSGGKSTGVPGSPGSMVNCLYRDRAGTLWAGREAGLERWTDGQFHPVPGAEGQVYALAEDADGTLLIGTDGGYWAGRMVASFPGSRRVAGSRDRCGRYTRTGREASGSARLPRFTARPTESSIASRLPTVFRPVASARSSGPGTASSGSAQTVAGLPGLPLAGSSDSPPGTA